MVQVWHRFMGGGGGVNLHQGLGGGTGGQCYLLLAVFLTCAFVFCSLVSSVSFLSD